MYKNLLRPCMIFIPLLLGQIFPQAHILGKAPFHCIKYALILMLFLTFLKLETKEMKVRREHFIVIGVNMFLGLVPFFLLKILAPSHPELSCDVIRLGHHGSRSSGSCILPQRAYRICSHRLHALLCGDLLCPVSFSSCGIRKTHPCIFRGDLSHPFPADFSSLSSCRPCTKALSCGKGDSGEMQDFHFFSVVHYSFSHVGNLPAALYQQSG